MFYSLRLDNIFHSASVPYPHGSLLLMLTPPLQKNKKFRRMAAFLDRVPLRGGGAPPGWMDAPRQRTPPQHTARRQMHALQHARRPVPSVCVRNVRLLANRKRAYLIMSVAYNIYNILVRNGIYKIYNVCHPPHVRRLGRLKNTTPPRIYTVPSTPPQYCHDAARTGSHRETPPGSSEKERREMMRYKAL